MTNNKLGTEALDIGQEVIAKIRVSEGMGYNLEGIIFHLFEKNGVKYAVFEPKIVLKGMCEDRLFCVKANDCVPVETDSYKTKVIDNVFGRLKATGVDTKDINEVVFSLEKEIRYYRNRIDKLVRNS